MAAHEILGMQDSQNIGIGKTQDWNGHAIEILYETRIQESCEWSIWTVHRNNTGILRHKGKQKQEVGPHAYFPPKVV